jgi:hypothetical protein
VTPTCAAVPPFTNILLAVPARDVTPSPAIVAVVITLALESNI